MLTTIGNLSEKGFSFFLDQDLKYEIPQYGKITSSRGQEVDFYIGLKYKYETSGRYGRIFALEENYRVLYLDMIQEIDGNRFRNYDNIDELSVEFEFDIDRYVYNLMEEQLDKSFFEVMNFIRMPIFGHIEKAKDFKSVWARYYCPENPLVMVPEDYTKCEGHAKPLLYFTPTTFLGKTWEVPPDFYTFLLDYTVDPYNRSRVSIWDQWRTEPLLRSALTHQTVHKGFIDLDNKNCNYRNGIYPEQPYLMDIRWKYGGYDVTREEFKEAKPHVFNRFVEWYGGGGTSALGSTSLFSFYADEKTVRIMTDIARVEMRPIYDRDKHILEHYLGPLSCIARNDHGDCIKYGYGETLPTGSEEAQKHMYNIQDMQQGRPIGDNTVEDNQFTIIYANAMEGYTNQYVQSESIMNACSDVGPSAIHCMYAIGNNLGKIGGQYIYKRGEGNEHMYFNRFRDFLSWRGWSLQDFMDKYPKEIEQIKNGILSSIYTPTEPTRIHDFTEFYDLDHRSPFDGIEFYTPIPLTYTNGGTTILKKKATMDANGDYTVVNVGETTYPSNTFKMPIDKDEYIGEMHITNAVRIFMSDYMRFKVHVKFKDEFATLDTVKFRLFASDFTYMQEREFRVHPRR